MGGGPQDAAAVSEAFKTSLPEKLQNNFENFTRDHTLSPQDAAIQEASIHKYLANKESIANDFIAENGKVVNTDEARKMFADVGYKGSNAAAVQEASSAVAKDAFRKLLKANPEKEVVLYAGGSGTGKTSAVKTVLPHIEKTSAAILDGNLSTFKSAGNRIEETMQAGKNPHIVYVYRDPEDAWMQGVIKRMKENKSEGGRVVPLSVFLQNHAGSYDVVKRLMDEGVKTTLIDNSLGKDMQSILSRDKFDKIKYNENTLRSRLVELTKDAAKRGEITEEQLTALLK
jgi:hypothetical protein